MTPLLRALALLLALLLAACAGGGGDTTADPADDDTAPTATPGSDPQTADTAPTANLTDGCVESHTEGVDYFPEQVTFTETSGVTVTYAEAHKVLEVAVPDVDEPLRYVLVQCGTPAPALEGELADAQVVEVPVSSVVTLTTTNLPHFDELGAVDVLRGVGTGGFVSTPSVLARVEAGELPDFVDASGAADAERVIAESPDLLVVDAFGEAVLDEVRRFADAGVTTLANVDFDEQTLLGRAEWLKVTALFLNAEAAAEARFAEIAEAYRDIVERAAALEDRPRTLTNTPYEGTWYAPGGQSFAAAAIADAGGDYVFADDDTTGSLTLDIETVLDAAADADVWLQAGSVEGTLDDLLAQDPRFAEFDAVEAGEVWAVDAMTTPQGGNAVYELAYTRADLYLADLFAILHPEEGGDHDLVFFGRVPDGS